MEFWVRLSTLFIIQLMALSAPAAGLVPKYYTHFQISAHNNATLMNSITQFLQELCQVVPALPCSVQNVTVQGGES